jgi:hypothetical protein
METIVYNLSTNEEYHYDCEPLEALITTVLLNYDNGSHISNTTVREIMKKRVIEGAYSYEMNDYCVLKITTLLNEFS